MAGSHLRDRGASCGACRRYCTRCRTCPPVDPQHRSDEHVRPMRDVDAGAIADSAAAGRSSGYLPALSGRTRFVDRTRPRTGGRPAENAGNIRVHRPARGGRAHPPQIYRRKIESLAVPIEGCGLLPCGGYSQSGPSWYLIRVAPALQTRILTLVIAMLLSSTKIRFVAPGFSGSRMTERSLRV